MATVTATDPKLTTKKIDVRRVEIDSGVTINNANAVGFNTDGECVAFNATAAMVFLGHADGASRLGDGSAYEYADVRGGEYQMKASNWTLSSTAYGSFMRPMYHTGQTTAPTFTRPSTYGQCIGYQDCELKFVQFSEAQRALLGIAGADKRRHNLGIIPATALSTDLQIVDTNWGRKMITKIGWRNITALLETDSDVTLTVYVGTAAGTATSVDTINITGTAAVAVGYENVATSSGTAIECNDGEKIYIIPTSIGSAFTTGYIEFFYEEYGMGGN